MSFSSEEEIECPCGDSFQAQVWNSVNLKVDPELRSSLMGGALNVVTCPLCKSLVYAERFVLVHDPDAEFLAFVHPIGRKEEGPFLRSAMERDMAQAQSIEGGLKIPYPPVLLFGMDEVVSLLAFEEEMGDQCAVVDSLAKNLPFPILRLSPAKARRLGLPRRVPLGGGGSPHERLRAGLTGLLEANDRLTVFSGLLKKLEAGGLSDEALACLDR